MRLKHREDVRMLVFSGMACLAFALHWKLNSFSACFFLISCFQSFQQAVTVHNFAHCAVFTSQWCNDGYGIFLTFLSGAPTSTYVPGHNESHHRHLETELDVMRTTQMTFKKEFFNIVFFFPSVILNIVKNDSFYMNEKRKKGKRIFKVWVVENLALHALMTCLLLTDPLRFASRYLLPTLVGKYMIITLNMLQHRGCDPASKFGHSRNFTGPLLNYLCFNNGFHTQHHNFPGLHWHRLKESHEQVKHHIPADLLQPNIFKYLLVALSS